MNRSIENYMPVGLAAALRKQAGKVWAIGLAVTAVWVTIILAAPVLAGSGYAAASEPIYNFFSYLCHQIPSRSFHLLEHQFGVCSRCFGVYFGLLAGFAVYPLWRVIDDIEPLPRFWLFLSMIPIGIDAVFGMLGWWENTHLTRFLTGTVLGFACATFIIPALVEIFRNLSLRRVSRSAS